MKPLETNMTFEKHHLIDCDETGKSSLRAGRVETIGSTSRSRQIRLIYKFEAFNLFNGMLNGINKVLVLVQKKRRPAPEIGS
jgi:hypothetical protein